MPVSRYPRVGQRIAPKTLGVILDIPVSSIGRQSRLRIKDLDDTVWDRFSTDRCLELADGVIAQVRPWMHSFPAHLRSKRLPCPPAWVKGDDIRVDQRTHNCLESFGFLDKPQELGRRTIGEIIKTPSFGVRSLVDLLCALESFVLWIPGSEQNAAITREAKKLRRIRNVERIRVDDPRFGAMMRTIGMPSENALELANALIDRCVDPTEPDFVVRRLRQLRHAIGIAERMTLTAELYDFTAAAQTERNRAIAVKHLGWSGSAPRTLESVGEEYGMTRERVRQVYEGVIAPIRRPRPFAPTLDRALRWTIRRTPAARADLEANLSRLPFVREAFDLDGLRTAAHELGRTIGFELTQVAGIEMAVTAEAGPVWERLLQLARKSVSHWGAATVEDIVEQLRESGHDLRNHEAAAKILSLIPDFRWLDRESGWFWLKGTPRNSLLTQIRKIFAVAPSISVGDLRAGVSRHHRRKGFAPPRRVLAELVRQLPYCELIDDRIVVDQEPTFEEVLSPTERTLIAALEANGGVMAREALANLCLATGMKEVTFYMYLAYSPVIEKYARGVYGIRGRNVMPGEVESLKPKVRRHGRVLVDYGWTKTQQVLLVYKLSEGLLSNGVASVPSALQDVLAGSYSMQATDGAAIGTLVVQRSSAWGLLPFFRRRGGEAGDYLSIALDPKTHTAVVSVGDDAVEDELVADEKVAV